MIWVAAIMALGGAITLASNSLRNFNIILSTAIEYIVHKKCLHLLGGIRRWKLLKTGTWNSSAPSDESNRYVSGMLGHAKTPTLSARTVFEVSRQFATA
jgi:hypothetical protein